MSHSPETIPHRNFALFAIIAIGVAAFLILARVATGETPHTLDEAIIAGLRDAAGAPLGSYNVTEFFRDATTLGGWPLLTIFTIMITAYLLMRSHWVHAGVLVASVLGQSMLVALAKDYFVRNRPDAALHLVEATSYSFPSGHSASAAAVYLALAAILSREVARRREKAFIIGAAIFLTVLVGFTRVYLGVHYPTDVLAGWAFGAAWASLVLVVARLLDPAGRERRG